MIFVERLGKRDENGGVSVIIKSALFIAGKKLQTLFDNYIPEVSLKHFSNLNCFGIFLQEGTPEERMCLPWLRLWKNAKNP